MPLNLSGADLRALHVFKTICNCGSFTAAQEILDISESTISSQISSFEKRIGFALCKRGRSGFELTERGKFVIERFLKLNQHINEFCNEVNSLEHESRGVLSVGLLEHTMTEKTFSTINVIGEFIRQAPNVELNLVQDIQFNLHYALIEGKIDQIIGVLVTGSNLIKATKLYDEIHHLYCGRNHPFFNQSDEIDEKDIETANWVTNGYPKGPFSLQPYPVVNTSVVAKNIESIAVTLLAGSHIGFLPEHFAEKYEKDNLLKRISPKQYSVLVDISLMSKAGRRESSAMKKFHEICLSQLA